MGHQKPFAKLQVPEWTPYLATDEYTLAEALRDNGYKTAHVGKWHLGETNDNWPPQHGFDVNIGGWAAGSPGAHGSAGYFSPYKMPVLTDGPEGEHLTERLAEEVQQFIQDNKEKPFFLNYWLYAVHTPLQVTQQKLEKYKKLKPGQRHNNAAYAALVEHMDDAVGKVLATLEQAGLINNTIIIFTSDNGGLRFNKSGKVTDNAPLRSGKGDMYEGGVRVPLIFYYPHEIKPYTDEQSIVMSADIFPTILNFCGIPTQKHMDIDGVDLSKIIKNRTTLERKTIYWHYPHYHTEGAKPYSAIRHGDWKLVQVLEDTVLQLYNLKTDIGETNNLAGSNPGKAKMLLELLEAWRKRIDAQMPSVNPLYDEARENEWRHSH